MSGNLPRDFPGVSIDSRTLRRGDLFVAIRGKRFDGHDFIGEAIRAGACGVVAQRLPHRGFPVPVWKVADTLKALGELARRHREKFSIPVVAVTGSSGKTTTKAMLHHILSGTREVLSTVGTQNNLIGVPLLLLRLNPRHDVAVAELGTNRWGEIGELARISCPTIGIVTNIGPAHLETFGNLEGVLREKSALWEKMEKGGSVILPMEDPLLHKAGRRLSHKVIWFGFDPRADLRATEVRCTERGSESLVNGRWKLALPLPGTHNLLNALAALACARLLGEKMPEAVERLATAAPVEGRLHLRRMNGFTILDDSYNANPASLSAALDVFRARPAKRKIAVIGDMLELGEEAPRLHAQIGRSMGDSSVDVLIAVGTLARHLLKEARGVGFPEEASHSFRTQEEAGEFLSQFLQAGDLVLVKGSRGMKMEKVFECFTTSSIR